MLTILRQSTYLLEPNKRGRWVLVVALGLVGGAFEAIGALLLFGLLQATGDLGGIRDMVGVRLVAGHFPGATDRQLLVALAVTTAVFFIVRVGVLYIQTYVTNRVALNAGVALSSRLMRAYLSVDYPFHLQRNSAELIRNTTESAGTVATNVFLSVVTMASELLLVLGLLSVLIVAAPFATLVSAIFVGAVSVLMIRVLRPMLTAIGASQQDMSRASLQTAQQMLHGVRDVKIYGQEDHFANRYGQERANIARAQYTFATLSAIPRLVLETLVVVGVVVVVLMTTLHDGSLEGALGTLGLLGYAVMRVIPSANRVMVQLTNIGYASQAVAYVHADLVDIEQHRLSGRPSGPELSSFSELRLTDVSFEYDGAASPALAGVDLTVRRGETIGIVGRTGAGKSTLLDLCLGLLEPTSGQLMVNGQPLGPSARSWQRQLGVVPQSIYLLDDSVRRNVAFGIEDADVDPERLATAVTRARLDEVVAHLPEGLETHLGDRGVRLSGGQRQRVAIARALYHDPQVLVFDEGTSALDAVTEREVIGAVDRLRGEKTMLIVAHRLTTVATCDRIVVLDDGRVRACASYDELVDTDEYFRELAR